MSTQITKSAAIYQAWKRGLLNYKLDTFQRDVLVQIEGSGEKVHVLLSSRRLGKSYLAVVMALKQCLSTPNSVVKFVAPTKLMLNTYIRPLLKEILMDCPEDFMPSFTKNQYMYFFKNGSELHLAGSDGGHAEKLRGSAAHLCIVDEAGFCNDLANLVRSILIPTTMNTKGKIILISTPPKESEHDFLNFMADADMSGTLIKKTIYDNPRIKQEEIDSIIAAYPNGADSEDFKREYLCEIIKDSTSSVLPEFTGELEKDIIKEWKRPPFYHTYEAMDLGFKDMTVILFAYYDFKAAKIVIEDEIALKGTDIQLPKLVDTIKIKEAELWTEPLTNEVIKPFKRVSDHDYIVMEEMSRISGHTIVFQPTKKDDKDAAINQLRVLLESKRIIINPRCITLIRHLRNVKWSGRKNIREFSRGSDGSHYDAVDAAIYLVRSIDYARNPYPANYGLDYRKDDLFISNPNNYYRGNNSSQIEAFKKIFKPKGRNGR